MQVQNIVLSASAAVLVGALIALFIQVQDSPAADVPQEALEEARQRHQRAQARRNPPPTHTAAPAEIARRMAPRPPRKQTSSPPRPRSEPRPAPAPRRIDPRERRPDPERGSPERGELAERMDATNELYDSHEYEAAMRQAKDILADDPDNVRMLRVVVSSGCIMGDVDAAMSHYPRLPVRDQRQMKRRCRRYGVDLPPPMQ